MKKSQMLKYFQSDEFKAYVDSDEFEVKVHYNPIISKKNSHGVEISLTPSEDWELKGFNDSKVWPWSDGEPIKTTVHNIVLTAKLDKEFNLEFLVKTLLSCGAQYNKKEFAAIVIRSGSISILLFSLGNIVCTGARTIADAMKILRKLEAILAEKGKKCNLISLKIQNIVVCIELKWKIDLKKLASEYSQICNYSEDVFPGCIIKHPNFKRATVLIFNSGFEVVAGLKKAEELDKIMTELSPIIKQFRILQVDPIPPLISIKKKPKPQRICIDPNELLSPMNEASKKKIDDLLQVSPSALIQKKGYSKSKKDSHPINKQESEKETEREVVEIDNMPEFGLDEFRLTHAEYNSV